MTDQEKAMQEIASRLTDVVAGLRNQLPHYETDAVCPADLMLLGEQLGELTDELAQVAQIAMCANGLEEE